MGRRVTQDSLEKATKVLSLMLKTSLIIHNNGVYVYNKNMNVIGKKLMYGTRRELFDMIHSSIRVLELYQTNLKEQEEPDTNEIVDYLKDIVTPQVL